MPLPATACIHGESSNTPEALDLLGESGFYPVYGARPLKPTIQQQIENPLVQKILAGELEPGHTVKIDVKDGAFVFN